jgi:hypothetical protein
MVCALVDGVEFGADRVPDRAGIALAQIESGFG